MRKHSEEFKNKINLIGRELDSKLTFGETELGNEQLNAVTPVLQSSLLKSVMKELDIDSNIDIPVGTIVNYKFGVLLDSGDYEYLDFGNYQVYSIEKQEDTNSYNIVAYDKMLNSMVEYVNLKSTISQGKVFPMTIRDYLTCLCADLDITFKNKEEEFANYDKVIQADLYANLGYTYRDVLDELAQVTASNIVINKSDELEIRYITDTQDTINEEYLKDINVKFGEKYGPVNSIVLSRAAGADSIYLQDEQSITDNGLCELKIVDNQIMNFNDRSDYLPAILGKLDGLEYYLNDFSSTGICYYEVADRYNVKIGENTYSCVMFNDEIDITQGLEEIIHTELPEQAETDYTKADKTDRRINQTYLIVDKQNQQIESVVSQVDGQNEKISQVTQTVDELNQKISNIADLTIEGSSNTNILTLEKVFGGTPLNIKIYPIGKSISLLYPNINLYPNENLYIPIRYLYFENTETNEIFKYELPDDLLYLNSNVYDSFNLDYENEICQITKKCGYNADGTIYQLDQEIIRKFPMPDINITSGNYKIYLPSYDLAYIYCKVAGQNDYTNIFATKIELNSSIKQTSEEINLEVSKKIANDDGGVELASLIRQTAEEIYLKANNFGWESTNSSMTTDGTLTAHNANIVGGKITLTDGAQIVGDDGLLSTMHFRSSGQYASYSEIGFKYVSDYSADYTVKTCIPVDVYIPNDFIVTSAYLVFNHVCPTWNYYTGSTTQTTAGYVRNARLYKTLPGRYYNYNFMLVYCSANNTDIQEIPNAFETSSYTPENHSSGGVSVVNSIELKDYLTTPGRHSFLIQSGDNAPSTVQQISERTGAGYIDVVVTGYKKY